MYGRWSFAPTMFDALQLSRSTFNAFGGRFLVCKRDDSYWPTHSLMLSLQEVQSSSVTTIFFHRFLWQGLGGVSNRQIYIHGQTMITCVAGWLALWSHISLSQDAVGSSVFVLWDTTHLSETLEFKGLSRFSRSTVSAQLSLNSAELTSLLTHTTLQVNLWSPKIDVLNVSPEHDQP